MQFLKEWKNKYRSKQYLLHQKMDQWISRNPSAIASSIKFKLTQRYKYSTRFSAFWHIMRFTLLGYLGNHLWNLRFNEPHMPYGRKLLTEYYTLTNKLERERLQQYGLEPHLLKLYERGRERGLTQIQLLQLIKVHKVNQPAKPLAQHIQYLRNLKNLPT